MRKVNVEYIDNNLEVQYKANVEWADGGNTWSYVTPPNNSHWTSYEAMTEEINTLNKQSGGRIKKVHARVRTVVTSDWADIPVEIETI